MTEWEAVEKRISCRAYAAEPLEGSTLDSLRAHVDALRQKSALPFQLCTAPAGEAAVKLSGAMFSGTVSVCAALVGSDDQLSAEKVGYYGQDLVLYATRLGLGTCWVAGTFDRASVTVTLGKGEKLWDVIPIGYAAQKIPAKQKLIRASIRARDRAPEAFVESDIPFSSLPDWVQKGVTAIRLGPSAVNQQPVNIVYKEGHVSARLWKKANDLVYNDLGIAKRQFEAGAARCIQAVNDSYSVYRYAVVRQLTIQTARASNTRSIELLIKPSRFLLFGSICCRSLLLAYVKNELPYYLISLL